MVLILPLLVWSRPVQADSVDTQASRDYLTVRELMRLEGEQALAAAQERRRQRQFSGAHTTAAAAAGSTGVAGEELRLVGIYGVGKRLFAEVRVGSQAWLFMRGHSAPVGRTAQESPYRLRDISGTCVRLEHQAAETRLCLTPTGRS